MNMIDLLNYHHLCHKIISEFNSKFKKNDDLTKCEICDELNSTDIYEMDEETRNRLINDNKPKEDPKVAKETKNN